MNNGMELDILRDWYLYSQHEHCKQKNGGLNLRKKFCHHLMPIFLYIFAIKVALPPTPAVAMSLLCKR